MAPKPAARTDRPFVLHTGMALVRTTDAAQMEALLARADVRSQLLRRLAPESALFARDGLAAVRRRIAELDAPVHLATLPAPPAAGDKK